MGDDRFGLLRPLAQIEPIGGEKVLGLLAQAARCFEFFANACRAIVE